MVNETVDDEATRVKTLARAILDASRSRRLDTRVTRALSDAYDHVGDLITRSRSADDSVVARACLDEADDTTRLMETVVDTSTRSR